MAVFRTRISHLEKLSSSLENLRETDCNCDFAIKVGEESFPVHRNVLIAASDYFRAMLSHDTKERQNGVAIMMEIEPDGVECCIEFMYTGTTTVTMETVENLLPAAEIMQLNALSKICVKVLMKNLKPENCISVLKLARTYNCTDLEKEALKLFRETFKFEEFGDFAELEKEDLVQRISDCELENELAWEVIINWIKLNVEERSKYVFELVKLLDWECFPSAELLKQLWCKPIFNTSDDCRNHIFQKLLFDFAEFVENLTILNCLVVLRIMNSYGHSTKRLGKYVYSFIRIHLIDVSALEEFNLLDEETILTIFRHRDEACIYAESLRWEIITKWIKGDHKRCGGLPELVKSIRFDLLSNEYVANTLTKDPLFNEMPKCYEILFKSFANAQLRTCSLKETYISVMYPDGKIFAMDLTYKNWRELPSAPDGKYREIFSFRDKFCVLCDSTLWVLHESNQVWVRISTCISSLDANTKITVNDSCIFMIGMESLSCYSHTTARWEKLPGHFVDGFCAAASNEEICVYGTKERMFFYNIRERKWKDPCKAYKATANASICSLNGKFNVFGLYDIDTNCYIKCRLHGSSSWSSAHNTPTPIRSKSWSFVAGKIMLFVSGVLYLYNDIKCSWKEFAKMPQHSSGGLGVAKYLNPSSVCSCKGDFDHFSKIKL